MSSNPMVQQMKKELKSKVIETHGNQSKQDLLISVESIKTFIEESDNENETIEDLKSNPHFQATLKR